MGRAAMRMRQTERRGSRPLTIKKHGRGRSWWMLLHPLLNPLLLRRLAGRRASGGERGKRHQRNVAKRGERLNKRLPARRKRLKARQVKRLRRQYRHRWMQ